MMYVISYDITDDKRRQRLAKYLESYGVRVQYSVFETELNEQQLNSLIKGIKKKIKLSEDTVRIYPIQKDLRDRIITIGVDKGRFYDSEFYIIG